MNTILEFIAGTKDFFMQNGAIGLFILSFAEASFFPVPPDIVLIPLTVISPAAGLYYAAITSIASTLGGMFGYFIGIRAGRPILSRFVKDNNIQKIEDMFARFGGWAVAVAGFTPIPYKVFTIASGVFRMNLTTFFIAALLSRSARFFMESAIIMAMGERATAYIDRLLGPGSFVLAIAILIVYLIVKKTGVSITFTPAKWQKYNFVKKTFDKYFAKYGEFGVYIIGGLITAGIFGMMFVKLATEMLEKELGWLDQGIIGFIKSVQSPTMDVIVRVINVLQQPPALLVLLAAGLLWAGYLYKSIIYPAMLLTAFSGSLIIQWGLKPLFQRPRLSPLGQPPGFMAFSFPSGTTLLFTAFLGFLIFLIIKKTKGRHKMTATAIWLLLITVIGASRIYLGISYPTDILAGFLIGVVWLTGCIVATKAIEYYLR